jgi:hypothetical protein
MIPLQYKRQKRNCLSIEFSDVLREILRAGIVVVSISDAHLVLNRQKEWLMDIQMIFLLFSICGNSSYFNQIKGGNSL